MYSSYGNSSYYSDSGSGHDSYGNSSYGNSSYGNSSYGMGWKDKMAANLSACADHRASCQALKAANPAASSGTYTIYPSGGSGVKVHCDMESNGGVGWTLVYKISGNSSMQTTGPFNVIALESGALTDTDSGKMDDADIRALCGGQYKVTNANTTIFCKFDDPIQYADNKVNTNKTCSLTYSPSAAYAASGWPAGFNNSWSHGFSTWGTNGATILQLAYGESLRGGGTGSHRKGPASYGNCAVCSGGKLTLNDGFFNSAVHKSGKSGKEGVSSKTRFKKCPCAKCCRVLLFNETKSEVKCMFNSKGTLCGACQEGFYRRHVSDPCVVCDSAGFAKRQMPLFVMLGVFVLLARLYERVLVNSLVVFVLFFGILIEVDWSLALALSNDPKLKLQLLGWSNNMLGVGLIALVTLALSSWFFFVIYDFDDTRDAKLLKKYVPPKDLVPGSKAAQLQLLEHEDALNSGEQNEPSRALMDTCFGDIRSVLDEAVANGKSDQAQLRAVMRLGGLEHQKVYADVHEIVTKDAGHAYLSSCTRTAAEQHTGLNDGVRTCLQQTSDLSALYAAAHEVLPAFKQKVAAIVAQFNDSKAGTVTLEISPPKHLYRCMEKMCLKPG
eukprot:g5248.t1